MNDIMSSIKGESPCIMCVQYIRRCSVHRGCSVDQRDTMSTSGDVQYIEGFLEYIGRIP